MPGTGSSLGKNIFYENEEDYEQEFNRNLNAAKAEFKSLFSSNKNELVCVCAPGRVNIIGEHIDYSDGFVFPIAIPLYTIIVGAKNDDPNKTCRVKTLEPHFKSENYAEFSLNDLKPVEVNWLNYVKGVVAYFKGTVSSFDAIIISNVPLGSGLSSSAALEISVYTFLENLTNQFTDPKTKALLCQKAEHDYASVPCGIMDQFISTMGVKENALLIDCRSMESKPFSLENSDAVFLIVNSNVKHQLNGSEYPIRRQQCKLVAEILGKSLRDTTIEELTNKKGYIDDESFRRGKHAVTEIKRTCDASDALKARDLIKLGKLMNESHESLKNDFDVSCNELDSLVNICNSCTGVYGSRMTGGGFGGCIIALVKKPEIPSIIEAIETKYQGNPSFYVCRPCDGARLIK